MSGEFGEIEVLVKRFCRVVDAIENDRDKRECLPRIVAISQSLSEENSSQSSPAVNLVDSQPSENCDGKHSTWKVLRQFSREVAEIHLCRCERIVTRNRASLIQKHLRHG